RPGLFVELGKFARAIRAVGTCQGIEKSLRSSFGIGDHPNYLNFVAAYEYWKNTDVLIGVGRRLELQFMRWKWLPKHLKVIRIDIDP
ncbi:hypothetical protein ACEQ6C_39490, partial [Rhizobium ruizarguesonis]